MKGYAVVEFASSEPPCRLHYRDDGKGFNGNAFAEAVRQFANFQLTDARFLYGEWECIYPGGELAFAEVRTCAECRSPLSGSSCVLCPDCDVKVTARCVDSKGAPVIYETQEELDAAIALWQKRLRLQDWDIKAEIKRGRDMRHDYPVSGLNTITVCAKLAHIRLLDPLDYDCETEPQDHERTLVHELIHMHLQPLLNQVEAEDSELCKRLWSATEQAITALDGAFVKLARGEA